jgi:hypothetical protein
VGRRSRYEPARFVSEVKRFTETSKWIDPWFIRLPALRKLFWMYICDCCDASGVMDFCAELAAVQLGTQVAEDWFADFGHRVKKLPNGKYQIVKFLPFQYGTVDPNCPAHKPVIRLIHSNGLKIEDKVVVTLSNRVLDKVQEKDKDKKGNTLSWISELKTDPAFKDIDVQREFDKANRWCKENKRQLTRRRFVNWLNRADQRIDAPKQKAPLYDKRPESRQPTDEEVANAKRIANEETAKLRASWAAKQ